MIVGVPDEDVEHDAAEQLLEGGSATHEPSADHVGEFVVGRVAPGQLMEPEDGQGGDELAASSVAPPVEPVYEKYVPTRNRDEGGGATSRPTQRARSIATASAFITG
jgi:hypothetical protein